MVMILDQVVVTVVDMVAVATMVADIIQDQAVDIIMIIMDIEKHHQKEDV